MHKSTIEGIKVHAESEYPKEACGLVVMTEVREHYLPCRNKSDSGDKFVIDPEDYADAEDKGEIIAIVHSHPDMPANATQSDKVSCEASGLPWLIVSVREGLAQEVERIAPTGYVAPLLGRMFYHGVLDCYTLVQDVYSRELGIDLPWFERENGWWEGEAELYLDNFKLAGFHEVTDGTIEPYDVVLMHLECDHVNHAGVFLGEVGLKEAPDIHRVPNAMLHHRYGKNSERVVYGGYWRDITRMVIRYER